MELCLYTYIVVIVEHGGDSGTRLGETWEFLLHRKKQVINKSVSIPIFQQFGILNNILSRADIHKLAR